MSLFETVGPLKEVGLICEDAVVLVDRQQGGKENLSNGGINLHSVLTLTEILEFLQQKEKITSQTVTAVTCLCLKSLLFLTNPACVKKYINKY